MNPYPMNPDPIMNFDQQPLAEIIQALKQALAQSDTVVFSVPNPDLGLDHLGLGSWGMGHHSNLYAGEKTAAGIYRPLQVWLDLADALDAHCLTPVILPNNHIQLTYMAYAPAPAPDTTGYGEESDWQRVDKLEDPIFLICFIEALRRVNPPNGGRVLALGVNAGHELAALALAFPERNFEIVGLDLDASALALAQKRFPSGQFLALDVGDLGTGLLSQPLGQFDLILCLSLLQSPQVKQDVLLSNVA